MTLEILNKKEAKRIPLSQQTTKHLVKATLLKLQRYHLACHMQLVDLDTILEIKSYQSSSKRNPGVSKVHDSSSRFFG
jgi:hypothetical protein